MHFLTYSEPINLKEKKIILQIFFAKMSVKLRAQLVSSLMEDLCQDINNSMFM